MTRPIIKIHNTQTNEVIEREMNDAEYAQYEANQAAQAAAQAETKAKAAARQAIAKRLGLTADELAILIK